MKTRLETTNEVLQNNPIFVSINSTIPACALFIDLAC